MSFWFTLPQRANLGGSQRPHSVMTTSCTASLSWLMSPWVTATVSELCKPPHSALPCGTGALAAPSWQGHSVTPPRTCAPTHTGAPDTHLAGSACSQSSSTRTKYIVLVTGCPLRTSALPCQGGEQLAPCLIRVSPKQGLPCWAICHVESSMFMSPLFVFFYV